MKVPPGTPSRTIAVSVFLTFGFSEDLQHEHDVRNSAAAVKASIVKSGNPAGNRECVAGGEVSVVGIVQVFSIKTRLSTSARTRGGHQPAGGPRKARGCRALQTLARRLTRFNSGEAFGVRGIPALSA